MKINEFVKSLTDDQLLFLDDLLLYIDYSSNGWTDVDELMRQLSYRIRDEGTGL